MIVIKVKKIIFIFIIFIITIVILALIGAGGIIIIREKNRTKLEFKIAEYLKQKYYETMIIDSVILSEPNGKVADVHPEKHKDLRFEVRCRGNQLQDTYLISSYESYLIERVSNSIDKDIISCHIQFQDPVSVESLLYQKYKILGQPPDVESIDLAITLEHISILSGAPWTELEAKQTISQIKKALGNNFKIIHLSFFSAKDNSQYAYQEDEISAIN